ncbi:MAG TPA: thiamine diphosphokinase [Chloroflexota bacterium]
MDAVVFAAAHLVPTRRLRARLAMLEQPFIVAADGGAETALAFGCQPDLVLGDFDSLSQATLADLRRRGVAIETYPRDKDATDGQLALERALQVKPARLLLVGFLGGPRLDQATANLLLLLNLDVAATLVDAANEATLVRPGVPIVWRPEPGEVVSLIPLQGDAEDVTTEGLRWPLCHERLPLGSTRGISNEPLAAMVGVSLGRGTLLLTRYFSEEASAEAPV